MTRLRKVTRRLWNRAKNYDSTCDAFGLPKTQAYWDEYRLARANYVKELRNARRASFQRFVSDINDLNSAQRLNKILARTGSTRALGSLRLTGGTLTNDPIDTLSLLARTHFPGSNQLNDEEADDGSDL